MKNKPKDIVPCDHEIIQITMTLAVESYLCDEHRNLAHESAVETVIRRLTDDNEIIMLAYKAEPVMLVKRDSDE